VGASAPVAPRTPRRAAPSLVCPACAAPLPVAGAEKARCTGCARSYETRDGILDLTTLAANSGGYDPHFFETLPLVEDRHFWFLARREVVREALLRHVPDAASRALFDIGCGSGGLLGFLERHVPLAGGCDGHRLGLEIARRRTSAPLLLVNDDRPPPLGAGQSLLAMFDVLEHIDDDAGTLRFLWGALAPGGVLVLTVPAHMFLFGEMDRLARHRRRYSRGELRGKLERAGFEVRRLTYFMAPLVPLLLLFRQADRLLGALGHRSRARTTQEVSVVPVFNEVMSAVLLLERLWLRRFSLPVGSSLIAVASRPV
jgi:SAM-dependent methyltransferase